MAQLQSVPDYVEGRVLTDNWRTRGGADLQVRGNVPAAAVIYNLPRMARDAMDGLMSVDAKADQITSQHPHLTPYCVQIEQDVFALMRNALADYARSQCRYY